jgi:hypothetical protein
LTKKENNILLMHEKSQGALEETMNALRQLKIEVEVLNGKNEHYFNLGCDLGFWLD